MGDRLRVKNQKQILRTAYPTAWGPKLAALSDCLDCQGWVDGKAENDVAVFLFPTTSTTAAD
jgi:hypothetical protein